MTRARDLADYISTGVSDTELDVLDGVTAGTVTASKALVVDANKDIASLRNITATGAITGDVTGNVSGTAATVTTAAQPNITSLGTLTTLTVDDITINGSTISDAGDLTLDSGGDIILDADGADVRFKDAGTEHLKIFPSSGDVIIAAQISDKDMKFNGTDGGSGITALTLDFSDAGTAIFNHDIKMGDLQYLLMGDGNDLELVGDGTNGKIAAANGNLLLDVSGELHLDADSGIIRIRDAGNDIGMLRNESNDFTIRSMVGDANLLFKGNDGGSVITALTLDMSDAGSAVFNNHAYISDNSKLIFGASSDLQIFHDSSGGFSAISDQGTGPLVLLTNQLLVQNSGGTANLLKATDGGAVELLYGNSTKLETISAGVNINGNINAVDDIFLHSAIYHAGDTDTYFAFGTDSISLRTGGSSRITVNNTSVYIEDSSLAEDYDALSGTTPTCNVNSAGAFSLTMSGNTTFTFSSGSSGYSQGFILQLTGNGGTVTWPGSVKWAGGTAPDAPANGETDILVFHTRDGGTNWYGALALDAAA